MAITRLKHFAAIFLTAALLPLAGAEKILFWNYYACPNAPEVVKFGSGLHRYLSDMQAAQILKDIVAVKTDKQEKAFAEEFLIEFCNRVGLDVNEISEKEGALIKQFN